MKHLLKSIMLFICMSVLISACDKMPSKEESQKGKGNGVVVTAANGEQIVLPPDNEIWCKYLQPFSKEVTLYFNEDYRRPGGISSNDKEGFCAGVGIPQQGTTEMVWRVLDNWRYTKTWPTI